MTNSIDIAIRAIDEASAILAKTGNTIGNLGKMGESANKGLKSLNDEMVRLIQQEKASAVTKQAADAIALLTDSEKSAILATHQLADANKKIRQSFTEINQAIELGKKAVDSFKEAYNFAKEGAQVDRLRASFETLGKSEQDLQTLRRASLGTIDDYNIMLSTNRAKLLGVSTATDDLAVLLQVAAVRGRAMGLDTTQAFNDIVTGIGRASPLILDNLGIVTGGEQTYEDFAKSIGKTSAALTAAEKRQALFNKVVQDSKSLGPLVADQATKFEVLDAKLTNLGNTAKETFADILTPVVDNASNAIDNWSRMTTTATTESQKYEQAITALALRYGVESDAVKQVSLQYQNYLIDLQRNNEAVGIVTDKAALAARAQAEMAVAVDSASVAVGAQNVALYELATAEDLVRLGSEKLTAEFIFQQAAAGLDSAAALQLGLDMGVLSQSTVDTVTKLDALKQVYDKNADGAIDAQEAARGYANEVKSLANQINDLKDKTVNVYVRVHEQGTLPEGHTGPGGSSPGYASGADFIVPPGYPNDSYPMRVQSGERVIVQTPAQQQAQRVNQMTMNIYTQSAPNVIDEFGLMRAMLGA